MQEGRKKWMKVSLRRFNRNDIPNKVRWINDTANNRFLHYDLPLTEEKTSLWYDRIKDSDVRYDAVIEVDGVSVGLTGLLCIDIKNKKAEFYISMGEVAYKGKGVATQATRLMIEYAFLTLGLNKLYLHTEVENIAAQRLFEKVGFVKEGCAIQDLYSRGTFVDRYLYGLTRERWEE